MARGGKNVRFQLTDCGPGFVQLGQYSVILLDFGHDPLNVAPATADVMAARQFG